MLKGLLKYWLALFIFLTSGYAHLSATAVNDSVALDSPTNHINPFSKYSIKNSHAGLELKIDQAEKEVEENEDESDLPYSILGNNDYSAARCGSEPEFFSHDQKKELPIYLIFCTYRI